MFFTDRLMFRTLSRDADYQRVHMWMNTGAYQSILSDGIFPVKPGCMELEYLFNANSRPAGDLPVLAICKKPSISSDSGLLSPTEYFAASPCIGILNFVSTSPRVFKNREVVLGVGLMPGFPGQGLGTEALDFITEYVFKELGMHRLVLNVRSDNVPAVKCYEKNGFTLEGKSREKLFTGEGWIDELVFTMLDHEWEEVRGKKKAAGKAAFYTTENIVDFGA